MSTLSTGPVTTLSCLAYLSFKLNTSDKSIALCYLILLKRPLNETNCNRETAENSQLESLSSEKINVILSLPAENFFAGELTGRTKLIKRGQHLSCSVCEDFLASSGGWTGEVNLPPQSRT